MNTFRTLWSARPKRHTSKIQDTSESPLPKSVAAATGQAPTDTEVDSPSGSTDLESIASSGALSLRDNMTGAGRTKGGAEDGLSTGQRRSQTASAIYAGTEPLPGQPVELGAEGATYRRGSVTSLRSLRTEPVGDGAADGSLGSAAAGDRPRQSLDERRPPEMAAPPKGRVRTRSNTGGASSILRPPTVPPLHEVTKADTEP